MQVQQHLANSKKAALVVTADNEYKEQNYHVPRCIKELEALGLTVDIFDLDKDAPELLLNYDVVEFIGGNPFFCCTASAPAMPSAFYKSSQMKKY